MVGGDVFADSDMPKIPIIVPASSNVITKLKVPSGAKTRCIHPSVAEIGIFVLFVLYGCQLECHRVGILGLASECRHVCGWRGLPACQRERRGGAGGARFGM
jgi:hypothetical protein